DRQGPHVREGPGHASGRVPVGVTAQDLLPVGDVEQRGEPLSREHVCVRRAPELGDGEGGRPEDDEQRHDEPLRAPAVEGTKADPAATRPLAQERQRDEEPGEHHEHVDAEQPGLVQPGVVDDDGEHRDATQPVDGAVVRRRQRDVVVMPGTPARDDVDLTRRSADHASRDRHRRAPSDPRRAGLSRSAALAPESAVAPRDAAQRKPATTGDGPLGRDATSSTPASSPLRTAGTTARSGATPTPNATVAVPSMDPASRTRDARAALRVDATVFVDRARRSPTSATSAQPAPRTMSPPPANHPVTDETTTTRFSWALGGICESTGKEPRPAGRGGR